MSECVGAILASWFGGFTIGLGIGALLKLHTLAEPELLQEPAMRSGESERESPQVRRTEDGNDIEIQQGVVGLLISDEMAEKLIEDLEKVIERDR